MRMARTRVRKISRARAASGFLVAALGTRTFSVQSKFGIASRDAADSGAVTVEKRKRKKREEKR